MAGWAQSGNIRGPVDSSAQATQAFLEQSSQPATPAAGTSVAYVDSQGLPYVLTDGGILRPAYGPIVHRLNAVSNNASGATLSTINALSCSLDPGTYAWVWEGNYSCSVATIGLRLQHAYTGTVTNGSANLVAYLTNTTFDARAITTLTGALGAATTAPTTGLPFRVYGSAVVTSAGTLSFSYGASGAGTTSIAIGSTVTLHRITP